MAEHGDDLGDTGDCEELDYEEEYPVTGAAQDKDDDNMEEDSQQDSQVAGGSSEEASAAVDPANSNTEAGEDIQQDVHADNASADDSVDAADDLAVTVDAIAATDSDKLDCDMNGEDTSELNTDAGATIGNGSTTVAADNNTAADTEEAADSAANGAASDDVVVLDDATESVAGAGLDSGDGVADSTGSENQNDKNKKPIKKITMEGFAGDREVGIVSAVEDPNAALSCALCNLVFTSNKYLDGHRDHRDHSYVVKGKSPNSGRYSCLLCWKSFSREELLKEHIERKDHISRCKDKGMIGFYSPPAKFAVMRESEKTELREKEKDRETRQKLKRLAQFVKKVNFNHLFEVDSVGECDTFGVKVRKLHIDRGTLGRRDKSRSPLRKRSSRSPRSSDRKSTTQSSTKEKDEQKNTDDKPNLAIPETEELNRGSETNAISQDTELMENSELEAALCDDAEETNHQEPRENNQGENEQDVQAPGVDEQDVQAPGVDEQDVQAPGVDGQVVQAQGNAEQDVQAPDEEMMENQDQREATKDGSEQNMDVDGECGDVAVENHEGDDHVEEDHVEEDHVEEDHVEEDHVEEDHVEDDHEGEEQQDEDIVELEYINEDDTTQYDSNVDDDTAQDDDNDPAVVDGNEGEINADDAVATESNEDMEVGDEQNQAEENSNGSLAEEEELSEEEISNSEDKTKVPKPTLTSDQKEECIRLVTEENFSPLAVGKKYGINAAPIRDWVKRAGKKLPSRYRKDPIPT